ncbi:hypothetical protein RFI_31648, partial [Reticulomyxa filosa]
MRELTQINDGVGMSSSHSMDTLKFVKRIFEKQEEYHQEEILRLGTEVTNKMERTFGIGNDSESPFSQSQASFFRQQSLKYGGIGPRSMSLKGNHTSLLMDKKQKADPSSSASASSANHSHPPNERHSKLVRKHNRSATLTAIADQMYEYKDYTDIIESQTLESSSQHDTDKIGDDLNKPLDTVREDETAVSESDESISSQEHEFQGTTRMKWRKHGKKTTTNIPSEDGAGGAGGGINITLVKEKNQATKSGAGGSSQRQSNLWLPRSRRFSSAHSKTATPQLTDLQQSMDELIRHLKQPSVVNFQKNPYGIPAKNQDSDDQSTSPVQQQSHPQPKQSESVEELEQEIENLKYQYTLMENTHQILQTNLKYKEAVIEEQKMALQNQKDFKS